MKRILLVDDEPKIVQGLKPYFRQAGFEVHTAYDGQEALRVARRDQPDIIVLDLMLPGMDGLAVCRALRQEGNFVPIVMLTARVEEADKLVGLELGADDYITKPFSPRELVARVRTVLRRASEAPTPADLLRTSDLTLDRSRYRVVLPDREVDLTPTEFEILATLASSPGRIFSRAQLLTAARGVAFESYERAIDSHIRNLRRKIEPPEGEPRYVITVHGVGYKFAE